MPRAPTVMLEPGSWEELCEGLISKNICEVWPLEELFHWQGQPLVNGLFAVGKGEYIGAVETQRLIMNLTPLNALTQSLKGDVGTLPGLSGFSGFLLEDGEVAVLSSEDIKCFFYLFAVPQAWKPFLGFNRDVPSTLVPERFAGRWCVLVSRVLPMGFANSVAIAQHIHRNVVRWSAEGMSPPIGGEGELRKDMAISAARKCYSYGRTTCPLGCPGTLGKLLNANTKQRSKVHCLMGCKGLLCLRCLRSGKMLCWLWSFCNVLLPSRNCRWFVGALFTWPCSADPYCLG